MLRSVQRLEIFPVVKLELDVQVVLFLAPGSGDFSDVHGEEAVLNGDLRVFHGLNSPLTLTDREPQLLGPAQRIASGIGNEAFISPLACRRSLVRGCFLRGERRMSP
jgi:hypothetical protein